MKATVRDGTQLAQKRQAQTTHKRQRSGSPARWCTGWRSPARREFSAKDVAFCAMAALLLAAKSQPGTSKLVGATAAALYGAKLGNHACVVGPGRLFFWLACASPEPSSLSAGQKSADGDEEEGERGEWETMWVGGCRAYTNGTSELLLGSRP